jgi:hypothetical protein
MLFDLSDEIELIGRAPEDWEVEPEQMFYAIRACGMIAAIVPVFEAEKIEKGAVITAYGRFCLHEIQICDGRVMLGSQAIVDKAEAIRERFFAGPADVPASWKGSSATSFAPRGPSSDGRLHQKAPGRVGRISSRAQGAARILGLLQVSIF